MGIQHKRILGALLRNERATRRDFFIKYGIANPTARISELRSMGYPIESFRRETLNKYGEPTHYCEYFLDYRKIPDRLKDLFNGF
ncbi:MAG: hypothetical protein J5911_01425 [Clostridia bacterium]|nr:hypothetical protein [Clostridia bacterium]